MSYPLSQPAHGTLYWLSSNDQDIFDKWKSFNFIDKFHNEDVEGWYSLTIKSDKALLKEYEVPSPFYEYAFLLRISPQTNRFLLLATHDELVPIIIDWTGWRGILKTADINVPLLVNHLTEKPSYYSLGALYARVDGYGRSLRSIALYGADLAEAQIFRNILPNLVPYHVQLRDVRTGNEIVRVGVQGDIGFVYHGKNRLQEIDRALLYLTKNKFLTWDKDDELIEKP